jgi:hypothetical protein
MQEPTPKKKNNALVKYLRRQLKKTSISLQNREILPAFAVARQKA